MGTQLHEAFSTEKLAEAYIRYIEVLQVLFRVRHALEDIDGRINNQENPRAQAILKTALLDIKVLTDKYEAG